MFQSASERARTSTSVAMAPIAGIRSVELHAPKLTPLRRAGKDRRLGPASAPRRRRRKPMRRIAALLFAVLAAFPAAAEDVYPSRPITLITPYAPGGASDYLTRTLAEGLRSKLNQTVLVQNVGGAGGAVGSMQAAKAKPDGYTLLTNHIGMSTIPLALQEAQLRSARLLRVHRPVRRGADGDPGAQGFPAQGFRRAGGLRQGQQGEDDRGLGRHGQRHPSLRHAVPGGDRRAADHGAVQGRRPGRDRPARRPGRPDLRPADHQLGPHPLGRAARPMC